MLRGCRFIILAVAGLALVSATPSEENVAEDDKAQSTAASQKQLDRIAAALEKLPKKEAKDSGCKSGEEDRGSDLCAQWKSADAAAESAIWTARTFWAGLVGLLVGVGTLIAAWRAAHWAKKAAEHAEAGAKAFIGAENANIVIDVFRIPDPRRPRKGALKFQYRLLNVGRSAAFVKSVTTQWDHKFDDPSIVIAASGIYDFNGFEFSIPIDRKSEANIISVAYYTAVSGDVVSDFEVIVEREKRRGAYIVATKPIPIKKTSESQEHSDRWLSNQSDRLAGRWWPFL